MTGTSAADGGSKTLLAECALHVNRGRYGGRRWLSGRWNSRRWDRVTADADLAGETVLALLMMAKNTIFIVAFNIIFILATK